MVSVRATGYTQSLRWTSHGRRLVETLNSPDADKERARLSAWYANIRRRQGRRADAIRWARRAIAEGRASGEQKALASAYRTLDTTNIELGRYEEVTHYPLALAIYEELGDLDHCGEINNDLGAFAYWQGRWDDALRFYEVARDQWNRAGNIPLVATTSANVAELLSDRGQLDEAESLVREALRISESVGMRSAIGFSLNVLGRVAFRSGRYDEALEILQRARSENHEIGDQPEELETDVRIAECLAMMGRSEEALELATGALARSEALVGKAATPQLQRVRGCVLLELGHLREAPDALVRSEALGGPATAPLQRVRGFVLLQLGRLSEAREALRESLAGARDREAEYEEALALQALALAAAIEASPDVHELEGEYRAIFDRLGVVSPPTMPFPAAAPALGS
jgi:tetratricopeptide (TPR) repeat protein